MIPTLEQWAETVRPAWSYDAIGWKLDVNWVGPLTTGYPMRCTFDYDLYKRVVQAKAVEDYMHRYPETDCGAVTREDALRATRAMGDRHGPGETPR